MDVTEISAFLKLEKAYLLYDDSLRKPTWSLKEYYNLRVWNGFELHNKAFFKEVSAYILKNKVSKFM